MLHASITEHGVVRGANRELVEAAAMVLSSLPVQIDVADAERAEDLLLV